MRISADVGPTWHPALPLPSYDNSTLPSLRNSIRNTITRSPLSHRFWHNDPDCLLLGRTTRLTDDEVTSAATVVGMTGGTLLLSDDLGRLLEKKRGKEEVRLGIGEKVWPVTGAVAQVLDLHSCGGEGGGSSSWRGKGIPRLLRLCCSDDNHGGASEIDFSRSRVRSHITVAKGLGTWLAVSVSNWSDKVRVVEAPPSCFFFEKEEVEIGDRGEPGYHVFEFWSSEYVWSPDARLQCGNRTSIVCTTLRPHQSKIFHIKTVTPSTPQYIGGDIHFTCGYEVAEFRTATRGEVYLQMKTYAVRTGFVYLYLPKGDRGGADGIQATTNGKKTRIEVVDRIPLYAGLVVRVHMEICANGTEKDGVVTVSF